MLSVDMPKLAVPSTFFVACVAVSAYALIVTVKILSSDFNCRTACLLTCPEAEAENTDPDPELPPWKQNLTFDGFDNETGTPDGRYIVPNYVHFVRFGQPTFSFVHAVCVLAALKNQRPEKLFIHTDLEGFHGKYWDVMMNTAGFKEVLVIRKMEVPVMIFGQKIQPRWKYYHGGDVARLQVMMRYGGIYLDSDSYIARSLDDFRRFEMALGWRPGKDMGNQIVVAHKDARFLHLWHESYRKNYNPKSWYYNAGTYPTSHILVYQPFLVHRVDTLFGVYGVKKSIYLTEFPEWRNYYAFHLLSSRLHLGLKDPTKRLKYPVVFDEVKVLRYPVAFREMCKAVYPFPKR